MVQCTWNSVRCIVVQGEEYVQLTAGEGLADVVRRCALPAAHQMRTSCAAVAIASWPMAHNDGWAAARVAAP